MNHTKNGALFSVCRRYRYALWRRWDFNIPFVAFTGVNPSTANESVDDPTIRRCIEFAKSWGYGGICMVNLFAYRATDPKVMRSAEEPVGYGNDDVLSRVAKSSGLMIAAWGLNGKHLGRDQEVCYMLSGVKALHVIRLTKDGIPSHPLYLPKSLKPVLWREEDSL